MQIIAPPSGKQKIKTEETAVPGVYIVDHEPIVDRMEAAWQEKDAKMPEWKNSGNWHASSLIDCTRKEGYARLGILRTNRNAKSDWRLAAAIGDTIHDAKQTQMVDAGLVLPLAGHHPRNKNLPSGWAIECDIKQCCDPALEPELRALKFTGRMDAVWVLKNGSLAIADIKTTSAGDFDKDSKYFADKLRHWSIQLLAYMFFFRAADGRDAKRGYILQIDRGDTKNQRLYKVEYDEAQILVEFGRIRSAELAINAGQLPEPETQRGPCFFCPHLSLCKAYRKMTGEAAA